jgi:serine/threonine-protein kinase HipA
VSLGVYWDKARIGELELTGKRTREYSFRYLETDRAISLSLPVRTEPFTSAESRPFFEALLPEGAVRDQIANALKLVASDSYGLLAELGRDCAGALQILEHKRLSDVPDVRWLSADELDELIHNLPQRPLGVAPADQRRRLSLAGVQRKAVLVRDREGRFGEPLSGMPSTHILKPQSADGEYPDIASNEFFCMRLAERCALTVAGVELITVDTRPCLVVERFDRDTETAPTRRLHQEDLCQALGLTTDFKYQKPDFAIPSFAALAQLLDEHSIQPGADRLAGAQAALFNFLVGNSDAHAKNISLLHQDGGVRLAPMYDIVSTCVYAELNQELALSIGDEFDAAKIGAGHWSDLAYDFGLNPRAFERERDRLARLVPASARDLADDAREHGWHRPILDDIVDLINRRVGQL